MKKLQKLFLGLEFCKVSLKSIETLIEGLEKLPDLRTLSLGISTITDSSQEYLPQDILRPSIKEFNLTSRARYNGNLTSKLIKSFCNLEKLCLDFGYSNINGQDMEALTQIIKGLAPTLTHLELNVSKCEDLNPEAFNNFIAALANLK